MVASNADPIDNAIKRVTEMGIDRQPGVTSFSHATKYPKLIQATGRITPNTPDITLNRGFLSPIMNHFS
jgi:hypothetical protein